jgi:membrane protease YdiL (CAAX protease family)
MSTPPSPAFAATPMSDAPEAPRPRVILWRSVTVACSAVVAALIVLLVVGRDPSPIAGLDEPEASLTRVVTRTLDLREAFAHVSPIQQTIGALLGVNDEDLDDPIAWYTELTEDESAPASGAADLYLAVMLAEAGRGDEARARARAMHGPDARRAEWLLAAYGDTAQDPEAAADALAGLRATMPSNWFTDTLATRIAERIGDERGRQEAEAAMLARGRSLMTRWRVLVLAELVLLVAGALAFRAVVVRGTPTLAGAPLPARWPVADGYGLFVRGACGFLLLAWLPGALLSGHDSVLTAGGFLAGAPALAWLAWYLGRNGESIVTTFGLGVARSRLGGLVAVTLALVALGTIGEALIGFAASWLDFHSHWADGLPEELLWKPLWLVAVDSVDTVLWTPLVEETMFRGVGFATLRRLMPVTPAALASALIFAAAHGYGVAGFASVMWSGILWAYAYHRTRSLWPAIIAHACNNLLVTATVVGLLRL